MHKYPPTHFLGCSIIAALTGLVVQSVHVSGIIWHLFCRSHTQRWVWFCPNSRFLKACWKQSACTRWELLRALNRTVNIIYISKCNLCRKRSIGIYHSTLQLWYAALLTISHIYILRSSTGRAYCCSFQNPADCASLFRVSAACSAVASLGRKSELSKMVAKPQSIHYVSPLLQTLRMFLVWLVDYVG